MVARRGGTCTAAWRGLQTWLRESRRESRRRRRRRQQRRDVNRATDALPFLAIFSLISLNFRSSKCEASQPGLQGEQQAAAAADVAA